MDDDLGDGTAKLEDVIVDGGTMNWTKIPARTTSSYCSRRTAMSMMAK